MLEIFKSEEFGSVRVEELNNDAWFIVKDVCNVLGIKKYRDAISRLDDDERGSLVVDTLGGEQEMSVINESGLYSLIFKSRKKKAKAFRKWVTSEVLPAIRKTGAYIAPNADLVNIIESLQSQLNDKVEKLHSKEKEALQYKQLLETTEIALNTFNPKTEFGSISKSNGLPKLSKRRGCYVANKNFKIDIIINDQQLTFDFNSNQPQY
jgi:prophage antirepressor-like protein